MESRSKRGRELGALVAVGALAKGLAACGGSDDEEATGGDTSPTTAAPGLKAVSGVDGTTIRVASIGIKSPAGA